MSGERIELRVTLPGYDERGALELSIGMNVGAAWSLLGLSQLIRAGAEAGGYDVTDERLDATTLTVLLNQPPPPEPDVTRMVVIDP